MCRCNYCNRQYRTSSPSTFLCMFLDSRQCKSLYSPDTFLCKSLGTFLCMFPYSPGR